MKCPLCNKSGFKINAYENVCQTVGCKVYVFLSKKEANKKK
jgi:hypothetical protein